MVILFCFFQAEDGIRDLTVTGVQTCALPIYEGGGSTSTYPFEKWFYRYLPGVGSGIEIEFVDPTGSGEYRIARNPDEKDAMLHVPGAGLTLAEEMGLSDKEIGRASCRERV